jgi:ankyrin repeat protein
MSIHELVDAIAVDPDRSPSFHKDFRMPDPLEIGACCGSLITTQIIGAGEHADGTVQLAHASVKDYLLSGKAIDSFRDELDESKAHASIVQVSLAFLYEMSVLAPRFVQKEVDGRPCNTLEWKSTESKIVDRYQERYSTRSKEDFVWQFCCTQPPFATYAAQHWPESAVVTENTNDVVLQDINKFYTTGTLLDYCCRLDVPLRKPIQKRFFSWPEDLTKRRIWTTAMCHAGSWGLVRSVELLIDQSKDIAVQEDYDHALHYAAGFGHPTIVEKLLDHGANINAIIHGETALSYAVGANRFYTVKLLLARGANIKRDIDTLLKWATSYSHFDLLQQLLTQEACLHANKCILHYVWEKSAEAKRTCLVRLLLSRGIRFFPKADWWDRAIYTALKMQSEVEFMNTWFGQGADSIVKAECYNRALRGAVEKEDTSVMKIALERGADVNFESRFSSDNSIFKGSVLVEGVKTCNIDVLKILLAHGANVNAYPTTTSLSRGAKLQTRILRTAVQTGNISIVQMLLDHGAQVNALDKCAGTIFYSAVSQGFAEIAELLRLRGANAYPRQEDIDLFCYNLTGPSTRR